MKHSACRDAHSATTWPEMLTTTWAGTIATSRRRSSSSPRPSRRALGPFANGLGNFVDFIAMRDGECAAAFQTAKETLTPIVSLGENQRQVLNAQKLFPVRRKLMEHPEARPLVVHTSNKNVWEAWRALNTKLGPSTTRRPRAR